ncbi:MAG: hypothetical protein PHD10_03280 [Bacilli bacterium]|nr:hypothetical protein [Bacilli bacterium]MDD4608134.1 hypothetical protein [Bacilli bacterium]
MDNNKVTEIVNEYISTKPEVMDIIGYGSAIKRQAGDIGSKKQIDLILAVENQEKWHQENYMLNPNDYSKLGNKIFNQLPKLYHWGTDINYLAYLKYKNQSFKLGVIDYNNLIEDLVTWKNGYLAGRLQKAVQLIKSDNLLDKAIKLNQENALKVALLLLENDQNSLNDLYYKICSLSYNGDIRMYAKMEDPNKVSNITKGSFDELHEIYSSIDNDYYYVSNGKIMINKDLLIQDADKLPSSLYHYLVKHNYDFDHLSMDQLTSLQKLIKEYIRKTNLKTSIVQPIKGICLNGIDKTLQYSKHKHQKSKINS